MQVGLKERLIGAAVLVIIAVIVIPWVLKGHSTPGGATVNEPLALPSATTSAASGPVQTYSLPLNASGAGAAAAPSMPAATTQASAPAPLLQQQAAAPQPQPQARQTAVAPAAPTPKPASSAQPESKPASAALAGKWVVQAGSYDSERSALSVEHKLASHGYHAFVSRYHTRGRTYYRVRVGPYATRAAAAQELARVSRTVGGKAAVMPNS